MGRVLSIAVPSLAAAVALWAAANYAGGETCTDWFAGETGPFRYCVSSYGSGETRDHFGPEHLHANIHCCAEGADPLPWIEGAARDGVGEWVRIDFREAAAIDALYVVNGWSSATDQRLFRQFNRLREVMLETSGGGTARVRLRDTSVRQRVRLGQPHKTRWIKLTILSTYLGGDGTRTALWTVYPEAAPAP